MKPIKKAGIIYMGVVGTILPYAYNDAYAQPAMDRSLSNGFRCMKELPAILLLRIYRAV
jgi:hypothetical protein